MKGNENKLKTKTNEMKWEDMKGKEKTWQEMKGNERKWEEMKRNEETWKEMQKNRGSGSKNCFLKDLHKGNSKGQTLLETQNSRPGTIFWSCWKEMKGNERNEKTWEEMKGNERKWKEKKRNERKWKEMRRNERKWQEMKRNERKWKEMKRKEKTWKQMKGNENKWKEMKGNERTRLLKLNWDIFVLQNRRYNLSYWCVLFRISLYRGQGKDRMRRGLKHFNRLFNNW